MGDCRKTPSRDRGALEHYMAELRRHHVMDATEEREAATRIRELRIAYWRELFSHPPHVAAQSELVWRTLAQEVVPIPELRAAESAARDLRNRGTRRNQDEFDRAIADLAIKLADADPDSVAADRIRADLEALARGDVNGKLTNELSMRVRRPPKGSQRFAQHLRRVRTATAAHQLAKHQFVRCNLRLVVKMAKRYDSGFLPLSDLIQEGNVGLMKAVDRFDPARGFKFSTYATWWIRHNVTRAIANTGRTVRVPAHVSTTHMNISKLRRGLERRLGRPATPEELAAEARLPIEKIERTRRAVLEHPLSTNAPLRGDTERTLEDVLPDLDVSDSFARLEAQAEGDRLREALDHLAPLEVDILRKRFGLDGVEPETLAEIGDTHSLSRERIRQLQNRAIERLRAALAEPG